MRAIIYGNESIAAFFRIRLRGRLRMAVKNNALLAAVERITVQRAVKSTFAVLNINVRKRADT